MTEILSKRAQAYLENPKAFGQEKSQEMRIFRGELGEIWVELKVEKKIVKKLAFFGHVEPHLRALMEALAHVTQNKEIQIFENLTFRELEAFLRDRNSLPALGKTPPHFESSLKNFLNWLRLWPEVGQGASSHYEFNSQKPFFNLSVVDKIKELKLFFSSQHVKLIYENEVLPELVDVDGMDVYLQVPYENDKHKALLHDLQELMVLTFREENLNLIPEP